MLNIVVCIKQVLDPEAPASAYKIDADANKVVMSGVPPVISPFDENAMEAALRIKDKQACKISVISTGKGLSRTVLGKVLAVGGDELYLLDDSEFEDLDSFATAALLTAAIKKIGNPDLILTGRQAADTNAGIVGPGIAVTLGLPCITVARKVGVVDGKLRVEKVVPDGYQVMEIALPCLITVGNELGEMRVAALQQLVAARKKPVTIWTHQDLDVDAALMQRTRLMKLFIPQRDSKCEFVDGDTPEERGAKLALRIWESKLVKQDK
ncbi:MAG: electron transfer flavoprotein subunit beta/FixA family protein [Dehalococcoidia bacterium]